ncbi:uncharacterized protein C8A04DRAFT_9499 [Dichotomopilus funicola]|uniref:MOSC domain-containing protein n=1 Tax=Dichotomopilus funicola TaxID=1934379 RepID=A0AAN6ZQ66_9PEZI|nr:hypothetical protein C8A04DRAFT_9499 [Dichotomopilus funicola]
MEDGGQAQRAWASNPPTAFIFLITVFAFFLPILIYFPPFPPSKRDALLETHHNAGRSVPVTAEGTARNNAKDGVEKSPRTSTDGGRIRSLWIYPIKSCRGIELRQSRVLPTGLEFDRLYMFAQLRSPFPAPSSPSADGSGPVDHTWHFITQRQFPLLATVQVDLFVPKGEADSDKAASEAFLLVRFPWKERGLRGVLESAAAKLARGWRAQSEKEFVLPVAFPDVEVEESQPRGYTHEKVTIWRDTVSALNMEAELPRELRLYLGVSNRLGLFRVDPARLREVRRCAPTPAEAGYQPVAGFQDAYPLHLLNLKSVHDFDAKIDKDKDLQELDPRRFRANIIVDNNDDSSPYDEETWKKIRFTPEPGNRKDSNGSNGEKLDTSTFHVSCRTVRCKMPNVDQDSGYRHPVQPDKALRKFREVDEGAKRMGCLGMQVTPLFTNPGLPEGRKSWVEVGMSVEVLERGHHVYILQ